MAPRPLKHTWGGKRGGGRPPSGVETKQIAFRLPPELVAALRAEANRRGVRASTLAAELLAAGLAELVERRQAPKNAPQSELRRQ